jgi:DNA-binding transcriptional MerR regulator
MPYTIKQIADLAGVTTRTLRYYDQIGLLSPAVTGDNGYRYYDHECLLRLQQIMFFRELDVPLKDIQFLIQQPDFNLLDALVEHRAALQRKQEVLVKLIDTIDQTIATIKGEWIMTAEDYFEGFDETRYEQETRERWGHTPQYAQSQSRWASYSKEQKEAIKAEGGRLTVRMVGQGSETSPDDPDVQAAIREYHAYLNRYFYSCEVVFLRDLADMWVQDPRFAINYERIRVGGAAFVREAIYIYCDRNA